jgi:hypothetical protein
MSRDHERRPADGAAGSRRTPRPVHDASAELRPDLEGLWESLGNAAMSRLLDRRTSDAIEAQLGAGEPLATSPGAGGDVRLHDDAAAADLSRRLGAVAFTFGRDIFVAADAPDLSSPAGSRLLGHELTHVRQQQASGATRPRRVSAPGSPAEREAAAAGARGAERASAGPQTVHRQAMPEEDEEVMTMPADTVHRQISIDELEVAVEGAESSPDAAEVEAGEATTDEPADEQVPAQGQSWDASIDANIGAALAAMRQQPPDARAAYEAVGAAMASVDVVAEGFQTTDAYSYVKREQILRLRSYLLTLRNSIGPHVGITVPFGTITDNLAVTLSDARILGSSMGGSANGEPTTAPTEGSPTTTGGEAQTGPATVEPAGPGQTTDETGRGTSGTGPTDAGLANGGPATATSEGAATDGSAGSAGPANAAADALYQVAVMEKVRFADYSLQGDSPDALAAHGSLGEAAEALLALARTYAASDPALAESVRATRNGIIAVYEMLAPMAGIERSLSDILPVMQGAIARVVELRGQLH